MRDKTLGRKIAKTLASRRSKRCNHVGFSIKPGGAFYFEPWSAPGKFIGFMNDGPNTLVIRLVHK